MPKSPCRAARGFSLIELMVVLAVFGTLLTFGIPAYHSYLQSQMLRGTSERLVQTVQLQRTRAMSVGQDVSLVFNTTAPAAWVVVGPNGSVRHELPNGVTFASANPSSLTLSRSGRTNTSAMVVFANRAGATDTVSIQVSGLALIR
ncbi:MAG: hypothetical protein RL721_1275 [Candidatus Eisenbacteria bacterium]|jgi:prepilin-type N-terminal cleavage/methylation domain-containing protein